MSDRDTHDQPTELSDLRIDRPRAKSEIKQEQEVQEVQENKENIEQRVYPEQPEDMYLLNRSERVERSPSPEYRPTDIKKKRSASKRYCRPCKQPLRSIAAYLTHQRTAHLIQHSEGHYCDTCTKSFKFKHYHTSQSNELACFICQKEFKQLKSLKHHLRYIHSTCWIFLPVSNDNNKKISPPNQVPDINDPNLHCRACDYTFDERPRFHRHLRDIHGIFKSTANADLLAQLPPLQIIIPDINDPNYHCSACDMAFPSKEIFRAHLVKIHAMVEVVEKKEATTNKRKTPPTDLVPEINTDTLYCNLCEHTYSSITSYRMHLLNIHSIAIENNGLRRHISNRDVLPDINDPNTYCHVCNKSYSTAITYRAHLNLVHFIKRDPSGSGTTTTDTTTNTTIMNVSEKDEYCRQCRTHFRTGEEHCQHIRRSAEKISPVRVAKKRSQSQGQNSVEYDPNGYCGVCKRSYDTARKYNRHMKEFHGINLPSLTRGNAAKTLAMNNVESQSSSDEVADDGEEVVREEEQVVNGEEKVMNEEDLTQQLPMENENQEPINVDWQPIEVEDLVWQPSEEVKDLEQEAVDSQPMEILNDQGQEPRYLVKNKHSHCIVCRKSFAKQSSYRIHLMVVHRLSWDEFKIVRKKQPSYKRTLKENDSHNTPDLPNPPKRMKVNQKRNFQQGLRSVGQNVPL